MTKLEFMKELESLLSDIPFEERDEALRYYNGYFDDAGEEQEEVLIKELGSPKKVAAIIMADLNSNAADRDKMGCFTEKGYQDTSFKDEKFEVVGAERKSADNNQAGDTSGSNSTNYSYGTGQEQNASSNQDYRNVNERNRNTNVGLIILLCIVGIPIIPSIFGIFVGIIAAIIGIIIGFGAAGFAMIVTGIALFVAGLLQISIPVLALLFCGSGLFVFGLGMLFTLACVLLCKKVLPAFVKGVVSVCRKPFQNRSVAA